MRLRGEKERPEPERRARMIECANDAARRGMPVTIYRRSKPEAVAVRAQLHKRVDVRVVGEKRVSHR